MFPRIFFVPDGVEGGAPAITTTTDTTTATPPVTPTATNQAAGTVSESEKLINDQIKAGTAKEVAKYLRDAGIEPTGKLKEDLAAFKTWKESQMTEAEKLKAENEITAKERDDAKAEAETARYEAAAARLGVPDDKIETYVRYARVSDGETPTEKMDNYLKSIGFKKPTGGTPFGGGTTSQSVDPKTALKNVIKEAMK